MPTIEREGLAVDEIPGAREELEESRRLLRAQFVELVGALTPGADVGSLLLDEPEILDWHEPQRHGHSAVLRAERPAGVGAADLVARAVRMLRAAGWEVAEPVVEIAGRVRRHVLRADHPEGTHIELRTTEGESGVFWYGRTRVVALSETVPFRRPDPVVTPETVTPGFVLCYECEGLGACYDCGGRGWVPGSPYGRERCRACATRRYCPICRGAGQLAVYDLSTYQRGYYPELGHEPR